MKKVHSIVHSFSNLLKARFPGKSRLPSSTKLLSRVVGKNVYRELILSCPDRRMLVKAAAMHVNLTEEQVVEFIANACKLPALKRIPAIKLEVLPEWLTITRLRSAGAIVLQDKDRVVGLVCVDPQLAQNLHRELEQPPVFVSSWTSINKALVESEDLYVERVQKSREKAQDSLSTTLKATLTYLTTEVRRLGGSKVTIFFTEGVASYKFLSSQAKEAMGSISARIAPDLYEYLVQEGEDAFKDLNLSELRLRTDPEQKTCTICWEEEEDSAEKKNDVELDSRESATRKEFVFTKNNSAKVLLVDDNPTFIKVLSRFLDRQELETLSANNGKEAIELLRSGEVRPALIVCDVHMPVMNGYDFVNELRADDNFADIPIIMLTSDDDIELKVELISNGADLHLNKSEDPRILSAHIMRYTNKVSANDGMKKVA